MEQHIRLSTKSPLDLIALSLQEKMAPHRQPSLLFSGLSDEDLFVTQPKQAQLRVNCCKHSSTVCCSEHLTRPQAQLDAPSLHHLHTQSRLGLGI